MKKRYDAIIIGSGPNGLAAAIRLQMEGLTVLVVEGKGTPGGGLRSGELTLPGYTHDICSAIHPLAVSSPFFRQLPLEKHGLKYILPELSIAHPFDNGSAVSLNASVEETALQLKEDERNYFSLINPIVKDWDVLLKNILGPFRIPGNPIPLAKFGLKALPSARFIAQRFKTPEGRAFWAGMAGHSLQPLTHLTTSAIGLVLLASGHTQGWVIPEGGSASISNALTSYYLSLGGDLQTNFYVKSLSQLPETKALLFDVTPKQLLQIAGDQFSFLYKSQLRNYRYGMGVFKIDWALEGPIPFLAEECKRAGTVHLGNTFEEIAASEQDAWSGRISEKPFVLLAQQSLFDPSRAPRGKHTAWAYCHVPHNSTADMKDIIETQVERFAPGFKKLILARHTMNSAQMEAYNPNYVGGDINGGVLDIRQLFTRPALRMSPYRTSRKGFYICSSSTPPGGGVHGMCGFHAAERALKDIFKIKAGLKS